MCIVNVFIHIRAPILSKLYKPGNIDSTLALECLEIGFQFFKLCMRDHRPYWTPKFELFLERNVSMGAIIDNVFIVMSIGVI